MLSARFKHPEGQWTTIADFNPRFAHPPVVWRRPPRDLALVLSCHYPRVVARDLTPRCSPSAERQGRRQRHATAMRKALTARARAENRPAGSTTNGSPAEVRAEPAGDATTHDRQGRRYVDTPARARNSTRAQWRPAPSHPWRRAATAAVEAKKRRKPIPPGG